MSKAISRKRQLSRISKLHYIKLFFRSGLLLSALIIYIVQRINASEEILGELRKHTPFLGLIWVVFIVEMILRFFPSKLESMGCQKQFERNFDEHPYPPQKFEEVKTQNRKSVYIVAIAWILFNAAIGMLYYINFIDRGILILISLAFSVCDMICILFFCPFHTWIMKNKCCGTCRIYNWDYAMMFTPLIFVRSFYTWSLFAVALGLLIKWEFLYHKYPERFSAETNNTLSCSNCEEKLCRHKKSLQRFLSRHWAHKNRLTTTPVKTSLSKLSKQEQ